MTRRYKVMMEVYSARGTRSIGLRDRCYRVTSCYDCRRAQRPNQETPASQFV